MWFEEVLEVSQLHMRIEERLRLQELFKLVKDELDYVDREEVKQLEWLIKGNPVQLDADDFKIFSNFVRETGRILSGRSYEENLRFLSLLWNLEDCLGLKCY